MSAVAEFMPAMTVPGSRAADPSGALRALPLSVDGLSHAYAGQAAVDNVSFDVPAGEVAALLGPSGCGKSTVLRSIAGLIRPDAGAIRLGEQDLGALPSRDRRIGMVFQNFALFPHMTVAENVGYPLACQGVRRRARKARVAELLAMVRLDGFGHRLPRELSGGQQQRVAVARALAVAPPLLLLDEPFGALDRALRLDLQMELVRLQRSLGITTIIVTHDQEEAQTVADRLILMNHGRVEQIGAPAEIYDRPQTLFANLFVGHASPLPGAFLGMENGSAVVRLRSGDVLTIPQRLAFRAGAPVIVTVRPEHVARAASSETATLAARAVVSVPLGPNLLHDLVLADGTPLKLVEVRSPDAAAEPGAPIPVTIDTRRCHVFAADAATLADIPNEGS
ncbi:MAG: ABC transporter ATP-binding protein [Bauldia sp.]